MHCVFKIMLNILLNTRLPFEFLSQKSRVCCLDVVFEIIFLKYSFYSLIFRVLWLLFFLAVATCVILAFAIVTWPSFGVNRTESICVFNVQCTCVYVSMCVCVCVRQRFNIVCIYSIANTHSSHWVKLIRRERQMRFYNSNRSKRNETMCID